MGRKTNVNMSTYHIVSGDKEYVASDVWKCPAAPIDQTLPIQVAANSGAHYWIDRYFEDEGTVLWCKYCRKHKRI